MDASEPRVRRRGFFLHSDTTGEPDTGEHENPEGFVVRARLGRRRATRHIGGAPLRSPAGSTGGRTRLSVTREEEGLPQIRSGSVTGSRQRAHSLR